ncbi:Tfp pilus assembly protein FimT/FimU [Sulfuricurvum sp.]|uniref:pilus assembly FimT family protein n=1 Tax=Sulfuricurvum sp. TaxID=2025608 RepID=UPI002607B98B|nr:prepilin-type N-terminal cleavage/methylation domain-containing protein [Sulfuricurvum sp.]MDD2265195.1 prepilin-type N-terminal cleavage/methylation domain-containing protein [Sulfuricurvum sp.]MDD2784918.1 prepilin-type N-terminal cleavage/methylation domain-containing protein [Sulfuricurvum sp.]
MKRFAFTMLELVFVIIIIGILAVLAMPNFTTNPLQNATDQVASHIRYTQHLAMVDDIYNPSQVHWYYARPQISFRSCGATGGTYYYIGKDEDLSGPSNIAADEAAIDPLSGKKMYWLNGECDPATYPDRDPNLLLTNKFNVTATSNCGSTISFDNLGRPYDTFDSNIPTAGLLTSDCNITLTHNDGTSVITIHPETGYVSVSYN